MGCHLDERFQVEALGGTARLTASKSERLSRREWKEARQTAKQLVNLV